MGRDHFTFFISFREAVANLEPEDRLACYEAIMDYALYDKLPDSKGIAYAIFTMAKPILDRSNAKAEAGSRGGSNKQAASKQEANSKQTASNSEADGSNPEAIRIRNRNRNRSKDKDKEIGDGDRGPGEGPQSKKFTPPTLDEVREFCRQRNSPVDPVTFYDFFTEGHWVDSQGNKVRNWKQKLITWEKHQGNQARAKPVNNSDALDDFLLGIINGGNDGQAGNVEDHFFDQGNVSATF